LGDSKLSGLENAGVDLVPDATKAIVDFVAITSAVVGQESLYVLHHYPRRADLLDETYKVLEQVIAGIICITLAMGAEPLATGSADEDIDGTSCGGRQTGTRKVVNVLHEERSGGILEAVRLGGDRVCIDRSADTDTGELESMGQAAGATE